ncbi:dienelactone hydrolase family protein [Catenulispora pinisilvae]|uniref:dienelactone hydrolase family protein n=1 Tax=Catenulispora pinisilvae TaxID=2705253 RepID=UPI00189136BB|nr:alpha/beta hydrolase [Catenulispora pinisilvae]
MRYLLESVSEGVVERFFTQGDARGVLWLPAKTSDASPLILLGHGGGQHKASEELVARAQRYVAEGGFAVAAIDLPGSGSHPHTEHGEELLAAIRQRAAAGDPHVPADVLRYNSELAAQAIPEWQATLDALMGLPEIAEQVGYWGVSLGTALGLRLLAAEPRITAAVLGLAHGQALLDIAPTIAIPIEFHLQWDDANVPRDAGLALFDAFGSAEKTLHANPGGHKETPRFEVDSSLRFFGRHLRRR